MLAIIPTRPTPQINVDDSDDDESTPRESMSYEAMTRMNEMRIQNELCDFKFILDDGKVFKVHKMILGACSDYFRTLFTTTLHVEPRNETFLREIQPKIMEIIIQFSYLRDVKGVNNENVMEVLAWSDYLGVHRLTKYCVDFSVKMLTLENCIIMWLMARYRSIPRLLEKTRNFILQHFVVVAVESKQLMETTIEDFHGIISDDELNVKDESVAWECVVRWIDFNPEKRAVHLCKLMKAIRMGLLPNSYFMENVKKNKYVEQDPSTRPIIVETMRFLCDLETMSSNSNTILTPEFAIPRLPHEVIFAIGGWSEGAPQAAFESYDTRADRWVRIPYEDPFGPRSYHGTAVIGSMLYCIGGFNGTDYFNTCTRFDAVKKTWREIAPMHSRRCYVSVATLNGKIYALGGYDGHSRQDSVERYCPKTNQWSVIKPMNASRSDADACTLNGRIYITGGFNGQECLNSAEFYTPETDTWTMLPHMISRRSGVSCVALHGCIYVVGGFNGITRMNTGEKYDPATRAWTSIREMYNPRSNFGMEVIDDMILAIGGFNGVVTISHCECYVPENNEWLEATDMSIIRSALSANIITGLPNLREYLHQERGNLVEDRQMRVFGVGTSPSLAPAENTINDRGAVMSDVSMEVIHQHHHHHHEESESTEDGEEDE